MKFVTEGMEVYRFQFMPENPAAVPVLCVVTCAAGNSARVADAADGSERWIDVDNLFSMAEVEAALVRTLSKYI